MSQQDLLEPTPFEQAILDAAMCAENFVAALAYAQGTAELEKMKVSASSSYELQTIAVMEKALEATLPLPTASYEA